MRTYAPGASVAAPEFPLYQLGIRPREIFSPGSIRLGDGATQAMQAGAAIGGKVASQAVTSAISSSAIASGSSFWGAAAGPIGAAAAVAVTIIVSLIAAHKQRLKDAKDENTAAASAVSGFYQILQQIVQQYNAGQLSQSDAIAQLESLDQATYSGLRSHVGKPGTAWGTSSSGVCDKTCTVGCCLYNTYLHQDLYGGGKKGVIPVMQSGGGQVNVAGILSNKYGFPAMPKIALTINAPQDVTSSAIASVESVLTGGSGGSILPLLLLGGAAFFLLR